jgi:alkylhydroperoxidase family enzyme
MKAYELLNSAGAWCQESPGETAQSKKVYAFDPSAVKWCALGAIEKVYSPAQWEQAMDSVLRALGVSEKGLAQLRKSDKACCIMEWNDDRWTSFRDIQEVLKKANV